MAFWLFAVEIRFIICCCKFTVEWWRKGVPSSIKYIRVNWTHWCVVRREKRNVNRILKKSNFLWLISFWLKGETSFFVIGNNVRNFSVPLIRINCPETVWNVFLFLAYSIFFIQMYWTDFDFVNIHFQSSCSERISLVNVLTA